MIVCAQFFRIDAPAPRHAQVEHHRLIAVGMDKPVFGAPAQPGNLRAGQRLDQMFGEGAAQALAGQCVIAAFAQRMASCRPGDIARSAGFLEPHGLETLAGVKELRA